MLYESGGLLGRFRCKSRSYDHAISAASNTVFEDSHIPPDRVIILIYAFVTSMPYEIAIRESSITNVTTSSATVADRFSYCREICMLSLELRNQASGRIGGEGHVVEVDECKIGRRKYHRGRWTEGQWILGMIDMTGAFRIEIIPNNKRDRATLTSLIIKNVEPGTVLFTDCWKGYENIEASGYEHLTVNHLIHFRDPDTWCDTQKIESQWRPIRKRLSRGGVRSADLDKHLCEYLWKREAKINNEDVFDKMLKDMEMVTRTMNE